MRKFIRSIAYIFFYKLKISPIFNKKKLKFKHINQFLSSFRFHEEGNSGMGDKNPKYKIWIKDRDRIFEYIIGRKKNMFDIFLKLIYKFEKLCIKFQIEL